VAPVHQVLDRRAVGQRGCPEITQRVVGVGGGIIPHGLAHQLAARAVGVRGAAVARQTILVVVRG
jgi:hypothetical protein